MRFFCDDPRFIPHLCERIQRFPMSQLAGGRSSGQNKTKCLSVPLRRPSPPKQLLFLHLLCEEEGGRLNEFFIGLARWLLRIAGKQNDCAIDIA